jgi:ribosomal protein S15P/S13E
MARIKQCCDFANDAGQPYSEQQILAKAHAIVFNTGLYYDALEKWDEVPIVQSTYDNFCKHIIQAQTRLQTKQTSKQQGYGLAVEQIQELTENYCNLVTHERSEKENDRSTINLLRQEMSTMRALIEQMQNKPPQQPRNRLRKPFVIRMETKLFQS